MILRGTRGRVATVAGTRWVNREFDYLDPRDRPATDISERRRTRTRVARSKRELGEKALLFRKEGNWSAEAVRYSTRRRPQSRPWCLAEGSVSRGATSGGSVSTALYGLLVATCSLDNARRS